MKMDETFFRYSALDSACMVEIHNNFWHKLDNGYKATYNMTIALYPVLSFLQLRGMKVNHDLLEETKVEVLEKAAKRQQELDTLVGHKLNVNSPKMVANYFYVELNLPPILKSKTRQITTDDLAMQRMARGTAKQPGLRQATLVQEIRGLQKLYGTYLNISFDSDNRMRGSYNPRGTKFGRLSSSKTVFDTGMNFQNLPQEFKKFLVADDNYFLLEVDKRQAEWVIVAYTASDANMIKAIQDGIDVHVHTASLMFNLPHEIIVYENKVVGHETTRETIYNLRMKDPVLRQLYQESWPQTMSLRQCGKKSNHGLNYDEGYKNFALINGMEEKEAKRIVSLYHTIYPNIHVWYETIKRQLQKDRTLTNCFGRKVRFMGDMDSGLLKSAYSMIPQSTVVDSLNMGMVKIYNDTTLTQEANIDILAQVHDSILMQVPIELAKQPGKMESILHTIYEYITPILSYNGNNFTVATDAKIGLNWGGFSKDTNTKGMRDYNGYKDFQDLVQ